MDIIGYENAQFVHESTQWECEEHIYICSASNIADLLNGKPEGCYDLTGREVDTMIGYGSFSNFCRYLAHHVLDVSAEDILKEPEPHKGKPFFELLVVNESGAIGSETSKKLATDFSAHKDELNRIMQRTYSGEIAFSFIGIYARLHEALTLASNQGMVTFS